MEFRLGCRALLAVWAGVCGPEPELCFCVHAALQGSQWRARTSYRTLVGLTPSVPATEVATAAAATPEMTLTPPMPHAPCEPAISQPALPAAARAEAEDAPQPAVASQLLQEVLFVQAGGDAAVSSQSDSQAGVEAHVQAAGSPTGLRIMSGNGSGSGGSVNGDGSSGGHGSRSESDADEGGSSGARWTKMHSRRSGNGGPPLAGVDHPTSACLTMLRWRALNVVLGEG